MSRTFVLVAALFALFASPLAARAQTPYIFQNPTLSRTQIAFEWGGDIWTVPRSGGQARRLVTGFDLEGAPYYPRLMRQGHDPQLEAAVNTAMRMLREHPVPQFAPPPYPNHHEKVPK